MSSGVVSSANMTTQSQTTAYNPETTLSAASGHKQTAVSRLNAVV